MEFISRVADGMFKGSELEYITLSEKLEYFLTDLLSIVKIKYQKNKIVNDPRI